MKKYILLFLMATISNAIVSVAQVSPYISSQLKSYLSFLNNAGFSGQILVAEKGKTMYNQSFGYANKETMYGMVLK